MKIAHANLHQWIKYIPEDILDNYGKSDRKRLTKALESLRENRIEYRFETADHNFFDWFTPLYTQNLQAKNSDRIQDVYSMTIGKPDTKLVYETLTVLQHGQPVGGCIFSIRDDRLSVAYRMYNSTWSSPTKIASPALLGEYLLDIRTLEKNKSKLIHGQDRHPYGVYSAIGVANFKLAVGCNPEIPNTHEQLQTETDDLTTDTLIFHYPKEGNRISEATLIIKDGSIEKYSQLLSYSERMIVHLEEGQ